MARAALKKVEDAPEETTALIPGAVDEITLNSQNPDDLELMFSELEDELESAGVNTGLVVEHSEDDQIAAARHITTEKLKAAALEELEENAKPHPDEAQTPTPKAAKKAPATKRISTLGLSISQALAQGLGAKMDELLTLDIDDFKLTEEQANDKRHALLDEMDKNLPKKVGEKVINLYASIAKGATLSTYTRIAIELLIKDGELTSKTLKDRYVVRYAENTASSQTTQMMKLLPLLGIATRDGQKLVLNQNSLLVPMINTAPPAAAEPEAE